MVDGIVASFSELSDPRRPGRVQHKLIDILVIAGAGTWTDIANYGDMKKDWLATFLDLSDGVPSHDTFLRVFILITPRNFEQCFYRWGHRLCGGFGPGRHRDRWENRAPFF
jgi:hypothetical protein